MFYNIKKLIQGIKIIILTKINNLLYYLYFKKIVNFKGYNSNIKAERLIHNIKYGSLPIIKKLEARDKENSIRINDSAMIRKEMNLIAKSNIKKLNDLSKMLSNSKIVFEVTNEEYLILSKMDKFSDLQYIIDFKIKETNLDKLNK